MLSKATWVYDPVNCQPSAVPAKQTMVETTIFRIATNHLRSTNKFHVCRLKDENVLKPPQIPTAANCWSAVASCRSARCAMKPEITPSRIEAVILTTNVPKGKVSPKCRATSPDHQKRHRLPSSPPKKTSTAANIAMKIPSLAAAGSDGTPAAGIGLRLSLQAKSLSSTRNAITRY
jgi:hypothetical protein